MVVTTSLSPLNQKVAGSNYTFTLLGRESVWNPHAIFYSKGRRQETIVKQNKYSVNVVKCGVRLFAFKTNKHKGIGIQVRATCLHLTL